MPWIDVHFPDADKEEKISVHAQGFHSWYLFQRTADICYREQLISVTENSSYLLQRTADIRHREQLNDIYISAQANWYLYLETSDIYSWDQLIIVIQSNAISTWDQLTFLPETADFLPGIRWD